MDATSSQTVTAPLAGIWRAAVSDGSTVVEGDVVGYVEAIKLDVSVTATADGVISYLVDDFFDVEGGEPVAEIQRCE